MTRAPDPGKQPIARKIAESRSDRLAAALRANLRRRKDQERGRGRAEQNKLPAGEDESG